MRKIPLFHKGMTVFFNFFKKSATKRLLAYRYGARKGNLTFFENRSLNRWLLSLYDVKEETIFNFNLTIRSFHSLYGARLLATSTLDELRNKVASGISLEICGDHMPEELGFLRTGERQYESRIRSDKEIPDLVRKIVTGGGDIYSVNVKKPSLEDIYFSLTAREEALL